MVGAQLRERNTLKSPCTQLLNAPDGLDERMVEYANSLAGIGLESDASLPETFHAEFIRWGSMPTRWAGAWGSTDVFCVLRDHSAMVPSLKPRYLMQQEYLFHASQNAFCLPQPFRNNYLRTIKYRGKTCSSSSLTLAEISQIRQEMSSEELRKWKAAIANSAQALTTDGAARPSFEQPVTIYLAGTDDTACAKAVSSRDEAQECLGKIRSSPQWPTLDTLGFRFS